MHQTEQADIVFSGRKLLLQQAGVSTPSSSTWKNARFQNKRAEVQTAAELTLADGMRWFGVANRQLSAAEGPNDAIFGACAVRRNFDLSLALLARGDGLLADGLPALRLSVLDIRATLVVPGVDGFFFINRSTRPFCGQPPAAVLGRECPVCRIAFDGDTQVASCGCGAIFHYETPQSHPTVRELDRLNCFQQAGKCGHCGSPLTTEEQFAWSPESL